MGAAELTNSKAIDRSWYFTVTISDIRLRCAPSRAAQSHRRLVAHEWVTQAARFAAGPRAAPPLFQIAHNATSPLNTGVDGSSARDTLARTYPQKCRG